MDGTVNVRANDEAQALDERVMSQLDERIMSLLDEKIMSQRHAIERSPDHSTKAMHLMRLGILFWMRFDHTEELEDIENTVVPWASAVRLLSGLTSLGAATHQLAFFTRFDDVRRSGLLQQTVAALQRKPREPGDHRDKARSKLPDVWSTLLRTPPDTERVLSGIHRSQRELFVYLGTRAQWTTTDDMDGAIAATRCIVELSPDVGRLQAVPRFNLSIKLARRFKHDHASRTSDLCDAIEHLARALEGLVTLLTSDPAPLLEVCEVIGQGLLFLPVGEALGKCRRVVPWYHRAATRLLEENAQVDSVNALFGAGHLYVACHGRFQEHPDLDRGIDVYEEAVLLSLPENVVERTRLSHELSRFSIALKTRYELFRARQDIHNAIEWCRLAISLAPAPTPGDLLSSLRLAGLHRDLSMLYSMRYGALGDCGDAEAADQECLRGSAALGHTSEPTREDLDPPEEKLVELWDKLRGTRFPASIGDSEQAFYYISTARQLAEKYTSSQEPSLREPAVTAYREAVRISSEPQKLELLNQLFMHMSDWDDASRLEGDYILPLPTSLRERIEVNAEALKYRGPVLDEFICLLQRVVLCTQWRFGVEQHGYPDDGYVGITDLDTEEHAACKRLMDCIPRLAPDAFSISRRYDEMSKHSKVIRLAVGTLAQSGNPIALQWFEQGRSLVWGQIRNLRTRVKWEQLPSTPLNQHIDSDKAVRLDPQNLGPMFEHVSLRLEAASANGDEVTARRLGTEREELLAQIRSLDGFKDFLQPRRVEDLLPASQITGGPIVCINDPTLFPDAFSIMILRPDDDKVRPFSIVRPKCSKTWRQRLNLSLSLQPTRDWERNCRPASDSEDADDTAKHVLQEMWSYIVRPVLEELGICTDKLPPENVRLPRITWCTSGSISFLPFHAAGPYQPGLPNAYDLFVSSYTPNIATLLSRGRLTTPTAPPRVLVVAQPNAKGSSPLPGTLEEAKAIHRLFPQSSMLLNEADGTVEKVFEQLGAYDYVHFACHGQQDEGYPLMSAFVLHDGRRLTLEKLMTIAHSQDTPTGELAFLSACETATGDNKVPDEAVHLAAGMLAVGYRSVVATMWSIVDNCAPQVAEEFYKDLRDAKSGKLDVARALHRAVTKLREAVGVDEIAKWAPFVHYGV